MTDLLIEIEGTKNQEENYFQDIYLEDLPTSKGELIRLLLQSASNIDKLVVYLSESDELLNIWEMPVTADTCAQKLLNTFDEVSQYVKKVKHES